MNSTNHGLEEGWEEFPPQTIEIFVKKYEKELQFAKERREEAQQMAVGLAAKLVGTKRLLELVPPSFSGVVKAYIAFYNFLFMIQHRKRFSAFLIELCELENKQCASLEEKIRILNEQFESELLYTAVIGKDRAAELTSTYRQTLQAHNNQKALIKESWEFFYPRTQFPK